MRAVVLVALIFCSQAVLAESASSTSPFLITLKNLSHYQLSPGGYVKHDQSFNLFSYGKVGREAVERLCTTGKTADFLYYARKEILIKNLAFSFDGGVKGGGEAHFVFTADSSNPLLSFVHKISFADDSCIGHTNIVLFNEEQEPLTSSLPLYPFDIGVNEDLHQQPPTSLILAQFNWKYWSRQPTVPKVGISPTTFLPKEPLAVITVRPFERGF